MGPDGRPLRAWSRPAARGQLASVPMLTTPAMLVRTTLYALLLQVVAVIALAAAVPRAAAWLTSGGFVTPYYDNNLFALKLAPVPWTEPTVYFSVQTSVQMLALALAAAALITLVRTNPWQHGALPDSVPGPKAAARTTNQAPAAPGGAPNSAPSAAPSAAPAPAPPPAP